MNDLDKRKRKATIRQHKLHEIQKMASHELPMQRKISGQFEPQKVVYLPEIKVDFKRSTGSQQQRALISVDDIMTTSLGVCIRARVKTDIHRSLMKRKNYKKHSLWRSKDVLENCSYSS